MSDWTKGISVKNCKRILSAKGIDYSSVVEKKDLLSLVRSCCTSAAEAKKLLESGSSAKRTSKTAPKVSSSTRQRSGKNATKTSDDFKQAAAQMQNMSPQQLRYQASAMRRDPAMVRRSNPKMKNMSDDQIRAAADQMEKMADSPSQMEQMRKAMQNMTPEQMEQIRKMQASLTPEQMRSMQNMGKSAGKPGKPGAGKPNDLESMAANITDEQISAMLKMLKENPEAALSLLKTNPVLAPLLGKVSDEVIRSQLDMFAKMDVSTLRKLISASQTLQKISKPFVGSYKKVDSVTGGYAKHILLVLAAIALYYIVLFTWGCICWFWGWGQYATSGALPVTEASANAASPAASSFVDDEDNEFEFDEGFDL